MRTGNPQLAGLLALACVSVAGLTACGTPEPRPASVIDESADAAPPEFGMQGERFYNAEIGYSFSVPEGWILAPGSDPQLVLLREEAGGATFAIIAGPSAGDTESHFKQVEARLARPESGFVSIGRIDRTLDGRQAPGVLSSGTAADGEFRARNWVVVEGDTALILGFEATPEVDDELADDRQAILDSFRFDVS